ncbi:hypothetical protein OEZ60_21200 [Defluviimonas sp. WL0024]|uniref:Uncharacterized protein n=1 Tax=Albidovulum salinarum TaxID=2984153 RepID=A0ABT2X9T4_9RHOB|nr:hypothetical protein [Defluviimonas sp. WL0024]MCU9850504.1 hypothetical protein [Defluviimonas sp. WL0024]
MSRLDVLHPEGSDFDRFLYAFVGEDQNGSAVTVLSALARLGFDPWEEAARLADSGPDAARGRLGAILSGFKDVPALSLEHGAVAAKLAVLLPTPLPNRIPGLTVPVMPNWPPGSFTRALLVVFFLLVLARVYVLANSG